MLYPKLYSSSPPNLLPFLRTNISTYKSETLLHHCGLLSASFSSHKLRIAWSLSQDKKSFMLWFLPALPASSPPSPQKSYFSVFLCTQHALFLYSAELSSLPCETADSYNLSDLPQASPLGTWELVQHFIGDRDQSNWFGTRDKSWHYCW